MKKIKLIQKTIITITLISFCISYVNSQTLNEEKSFIEVSGYAEKEVIPDEIFISIIIKEQFENKVKVTIESQEEKLQSIVSNLGLDPKDLTLSDANAGYVRVKWRSKDVITKKDYTLKVKNSTIVGQVFQQLEELKMNIAYISKVSHSKIDSLKKEVKILSIKSAKEKADYLLNAIGEQTGKPLIIRETQNGLEGLTGAMGGVSIRGSRTENSDYYIDGPSISDKAKDEILFRKIKIESGIYVKFEIK